MIFLYIVSIYKNMERMNISLGTFLIIIVGSVLYSRKKDRQLLETHDYDDEQSTFMRKVLIDETQLSKVRVLLFHLDLAHLLIQANAFH